MSLKNYKLAENSYVCIQAFMRNDLNLKGNELMLYALIFGFNQDQDSEFNGSLSYIMNWIGVSKPTAISLLKTLEEKDLIIKESKYINNIKLNSYVINFKKIVQTKKECDDFENDFHAKENEEDVENSNLTSSKEILPPTNEDSKTPVKRVVKKINHQLNNLTGSKEILPGVVKKLNQGGKETLPNNIINNINNNTNPERTTRHKGIPKLEDIISYSKRFRDNLFLNPEEFFEYNQQRDWKDDKEIPIKNWKALFNNWNNKEKLRYEKSELDKKLREEKLKNAKAKQETVLNNKYKFSCPKCKTKIVPSESTYDKNTGIARCNKCNLAFKVA